MDVRHRNRLLQQPLTIWLSLCVATTNDTDISLRYGLHGRSIVVRTRGEEPRADLRGQHVRRVGGLGQAASDKNRLAPEQSGQFISIVRLHGLVHEAQFAR